MGDFVLAMEKMTANGYPNGLTPAPDHWTGVTCDLPKNVDRPVTCYKPEAAGSGDAMFIQSIWDKTLGWALQQDSVTGKLFFGPVDTESDPTPFQLWVWSESGAQLINVGTGTSMAVDGYSSFKIVSGVGYKQIRSTYQPNQGFDCWFGPTEGRVTLYGAHGGGNQQWKVTTYKHQGGAIAPCVGEAVVSGSSFQMINVMKKKVLHVNADGSVTMSKNSDQKWKWATNSCNPELLYLSSVPSGLILASDGKTVTDTLEENAWTYDEVEMTMESEIGGFLSDTKKHGIKVRGLRNNKEGKPWKWFRWNLV